MSLILALDLGTSAIKILLMDPYGNILHLSSHPYPSEMPQQGWIQQDPEIWFDIARKAVNNRLSDVDKKDIGVISLSGHMSGMVAVDSDGKSLYPCITMADGRSSRQCDEINATAGSHIVEITGNMAINAFLAPKLLWFKQNNPSAYRQAKAIVSPKDFLRFKLTGKLATDSTDAGNSLLFNIHKRCWDETLIKELGFDTNKFPEVSTSYEIAGTLTCDAANALGLRHGIPVAFGAADMACQAIGAGLTYKGVVSATVGTSATMLTVLDTVKNAGVGRVTFHPHVMPGLIYALGSHFSGGLSLNWFSRVISEDNAEKLDYAFLDKLTEEAAQRPVGSNGLLFLPFLVGSGSPHFSANIKGSFIGLSIFTDRGSMYRSIMEGVSYNMKETFQLFESMCEGIETIRFGGGGLKAKIWPQIFADIFGRNVQISGNFDESTIGAAIIGGYSAGIFKSLKLPTKIKNNKMEIVYNEENTQKYQGLFALYLESYEKLMDINKKLKSY
jgi:xylulokinase